MKGARFEIYKKQPIILGAAVERCSGSKLPGLQLYFMDVFDDSGHIFPTCSKESIKILKVGKNFRCVISFCQYFLVTDKICYNKNNSGNSHN